MSALQSSGKAALPTITTPLNWTPARRNSMPDADITVMVWLVHDDGHGEWFSGWWDGIGWCDCVSGGYFPDTVTHWAEPMGPNGEV